MLNRMHLDEWTAEPVAAILDSLQGHPAITGYTRQAPAPGEKSRRGRDGNITDCFPGSPDGNMEQRDAWTVTRLSRNADLVLDIHGTRDRDETFPFYGPAGRSSALLAGTASLLGCEHAVVLQAPHPAGTLPNYVGWDLGPGNAVLTMLPGWLTAITAGWIPPTRPMAEYRLVEGSGKATPCGLGSSGTTRRSPGYRIGRSARLASRFPRTPSPGQQTFMLIPATGARWHCLTVVVNLGSRNIVQQCLNLA